MQTAIFGIHNSGLNLVVSLIVFMLVVVWVALIVWSYLDARRRIEDQVLVLCATAASLFPYIGTFVYVILRPPDFLDDVRERDLEIRAAELRVRQLAELSCPNCGFSVEKNYLRCPNCQRRLKDPCQKCGKPVDPRWALCPYCENPMPGRQRKPQRSSGGERRQARARGSEAAPEPPRRKEPSEEKPKRSSRQSDGASRSGGSRRPKSSRSSGDKPADSEKAAASSPEASAGDQPTEERSS
jgi:hypothetical protein